MKKLFWSAGAAALSSAALLALSAGSASAAQYITQLVYNANGLTTSYGQVTLTEGGSGNGAYVDVDVSFYPTSGVQRIVDDGNGHVAFGFNLVDDPSESTITNLTAGYGDTMDGNLKNSPFGHFEDVVTLSGNGAVNGIAPPLDFRVVNPTGVHFLTGTNHFTSNTDGSVGALTGGWWFAVDVYDPTHPLSVPGNDPSNTFAIAGRDFCTVGVNCGGVPEPASWALMLLGFGGIGAVLRRRRPAAALA
ncbi:MAG TPA: PEPxxWA-CTERM sorting domain-containing protein [Phenylobacterium sp.]|jgi:hypothetical protein|nr:PEPxxWA-CTERM sorting domain-containing protein [Phenylobacterium sp.]